MNISDVISTQLFSWAIYAIILFVLCLSTIKLSQGLSKLFMNGVIGSSLILIFNCLFCRLGLTLGINLMTVFLSSILGLPSIGLMYLILYII